MNDTQKSELIALEVEESASEEIAWALWELGAEAVEERDTATLERAAEGRVELRASFAETPELSALRELDGVLEVRSQQFEGAPWLENWRRFFEPIVLNETLWLVPPWKQGAAPAGVRELVIDPGQAFGTGQHISTRLALRALAQLELRDQPLLDVGCGTGILAFCGLIAGAVRATCVDIDPIALRELERNAARNGLSEGLTQPLHTSVEAVQGRFPVVLANIELNPLKRLLPALLARRASGGALILSGLLETQREEMQHCLPAQLETQPFEEDGWVALLCTERAVA